MLPAVRGKERQAERRDGETEKNIFHPVTNREHLITEGPCVGGPGFLELVSVL